MTPPELSNSSRCSSDSGSFWDKDDCSSTHTSLSSLSGVYLEALQLEENFRSPLATELDTAALDPFTDAELPAVSANVDNASPIELSRDRWASPSSGEPMLISSSSFLDLVDPELENTLLPSPISSLPTNAASLKDDSNQTLAALPKHIEAEPLPSQEGGQPVAVDAYGEIWDAEELLAKWSRGRTTWYLVKWKGFPQDANTWEKRKDISPDLIQSFEVTYEGNHSGVWLLDKRTRSGKIEYLVKWKGRAEKEKSWEKESTISRVRIREFEERT